MPCSQKTETANKPFGILVLKALLSEILGRRECKTHAESDRATAIVVVGAHRRRVVDDCE